MKLSTETKSEDQEFIQEMDKALISLQILPTSVDV
jgi:hypothetical protein